MTQTQTVTPASFRATRLPEELDVVSAVTEALRQANHPQPELWLQDPLIQQAAPAAPKLQQFLINRYWRLQFGGCAASTTAERYCLTDDSAPKEYLKIFTGAVAPAIVRLGLPSAG